ncbi:MAG: uroporphyrinogen-III synthase [Rhizomicrobium sp.]
MARALMRVLVTRPKEDARGISETLRAQGHEVVVAPLLDIHFHDGPPVALDGVAAILATSANGVRAIARRTHRRDVPVFAVGPQTAKEAARAGFTHIKNANGDGAALARAAAGWANPQDGVLLHAAGAEAPKHLATDLEKEGFAVRREILYEARAARQLPDDAADALRSAALDAVLLFSPRSAATFAACVLRENLGVHCEDLTALCISEATARALAPLVFRAIRVAEAPNQEALLALLA